MKCNLASCLRGTIAAVFILRRLQEECHAKGKKLYMCFVDLDKSLDRVPRKVMDWAMRKKGIPEVFVSSAMCLYEGVKPKVRVDSELSEELEVKIVMHQGSVLTPLLLAVVVDVVTEFVCKGALSELLYADDLVLMSETIMGLRNKFLKWKEAFESKGLKVNLEKTKAMISDSITKDGMSKSKVDPCGVCSWRVKSNSDLCLWCGEWIYGRCAGVKRLTPKIKRNFACTKCEVNIGEAV